MDATLKKEVEASIRKSLEAQTGKSSADVHFESHTVKQSLVQVKMTYKLVTKSYKLPVSDISDMQKAVIARDPAELDSKLQKDLDSIHQDTKLHAMFREKVSKLDDFGYGLSGQLPIYAHPALYMLVLTCANCSGSGRLTCGACRGTMRVNCHVCYGRGKRSCSHCSGSGKTSHTENYYENVWNYGTNSYDSVSRSRTVYNTCSLCYGAGDTNCIYCAGSGEINCSSCHGGKVTCGTCSGHGVVTHSYEIGTIAEISYSGQVEAESISIQKIVDSLPPEKYFRSGLARFNGGAVDESNSNAYAIRAQFTGTIPSYYSELEYRGMQYDCFSYGHTISPHRMPGLPEAMLATDFIKLMQNPGDKQVMKEYLAPLVLQTAKELLKPYLGEEKIISVGSSAELSAKMEGALSAEYLQHMHTYLQAFAALRRKARFRMLMIVLAVLTLIGLGWHLFSGQADTPATTSPSANVSDNATPVAATADAGNSQPEEDAIEKKIKHNKGYCNPEYTYCPGNPNSGGSTGAAARNLLNHGL